MRKADFLELRYGEVRLRVLAVSFVCCATHPRFST